ncbi:MAG: malonate transporter subunit MadL [Neisseriaceae bacterium]|nr:malonate transporter subunit MadL [Neisseriaceae bacterium]MBP6861535.1 malonate transporter subunit MadL [Neisseriaceae bacterium]
MVIYGVAILAACMLIGLMAGDFLGFIFGINTNVGGIGLAMIFLVLATDYANKRRLFSVVTQRGLEFWGAMYIPIVVAMAATQNVAGALDGGALAIMAGLVATVASWLLVPLLSRPQRR